MIQHIKDFMNITTMHSKSVGMTFIRKFGPAPIPGKTIVVLMTMVAVPDAEAERITAELHAPTLGACQHGSEVIVLSISTGEGKDLSLTRDESLDTGSKGATFDGLLRQPIWRFG